MAIFVGFLPEEFSTATDLDEKNDCFSASRRYISTIFCGGQKVIKSHNYFVRNTEGPVVTMMGDIVGKVKIVIIGNTTPEAKACCVDTTSTGQYHDSGLPSNLEENITFDDSSYNVPPQASFDNASASTDYCSIRRTSLIQSETATNENNESFYILRRSSDFLSDSNWSHAPKAYPCLFPFGRGGPAEFRSVAVSVNA
ncbi:hypothetical protein BC829DRAFT_446358 [Chytridium lagenaria]|nr:hypothetical protein BC829DRAFT_446358 [Chytridium lagenaria]